jgi:hypothetical protein
MKRVLTCGAVALTAAAVTLAPRPASADTSTSTTFTATSANIRCDPADSLSQTRFDATTIQHGLIGTEENCPEIQPTVLAAFGSAYRHFIPAAASNVPLFWTRRRWRRLSAGSQTISSPGQRVRSATWVMLRNRVIHRNLIRVGTHWIARAWTTHPERQPEWLVEQANTENLVTSLRAAHPHAAIVITGDFNGAESPDPGHMLGTVAVQDAWTPSDSIAVLHVPGRHLSVRSTSEVTCKAPDTTPVRCEPDGTLFTDHTSQSVRYTFTG